MSLTSATRSGTNRKAVSPWSTARGRHGDAGTAGGRWRGLHVYPASLGDLPNLSAVPTPTSPVPWALSLAPAPRGGGRTDWKGRGRASGNRSAPRRRPPSCWVSSPSASPGVWTPVSPHSQEPQSLYCHLLEPFHTRTEAPSPRASTQDQVWPSPRPCSFAHAESARPEHCGPRGRPGDPGPLCADINTTRPTGPQQLTLTGGHPQAPGEKFSDLRPKAQHERKKRTNWPSSKLKTGASRKTFSLDENKSYRVGENTNESGQRLTCRTY